MVKLGDHISGLMRLIRWPNLLIVAVTQILIRMCIISPLLQRAYMEPQMSPVLFALLVVATVCITAGGYVINDYFDRKIDRINKPDSMIVGSLVSPRHAMAYHIIFSITGIIAGIMVAWKIGQIYLSLIFFMVSGLLWFYSTIYKREFLLGNIIVALLTALVPFIVLLFELPLLARNYGADVNPITRILLIWVLGFSMFAFLVNLMREIVKDIEDFEGDHAYGKKTIPVIWGINTARWISVTITIIIIALLIAAWFFFIRDYITMIYFLVMLVIPLCLISVFLIKGSDQSTFHNASIWLKIIMLSGLGYMIVVNLIINRLQ
jgi:4-hydroxybenzoate polyprenyltransferase